MKKYSALQKAYAKNKGIILPVDKIQNKRIAKIEANYKPEVKSCLTSDDAGGLINYQTNAIYTKSLDAIAQGDTSSSRQANQIKVTGINFKLHVYNETNTLAGNYFRVFIVYDKTYRGTVLTGAQLLSHYSTTNLNFTNMVSARNENYIDNPRNGVKGVKILYEKTVYFGQNSTTAGCMGNYLHVLNYNKTFKTPLKINYSDVNATDQREGHIYLIILGGASTTNTSNPYYVFDNQLRFTD